MFQLAVEWAFNLSHTQVTYITYTPSVIPKIFGHSGCLCSVNMLMMSGLANEYHYNSSLCPVFLTFVLQPVLHEYAARPSLADGFSLGLSVTFSTESPESPEVVILSPSLPFDLCDIVLIAQVNGHIIH